MALNRQSVSSTEEKRIVLGMIVSTEFCEAIKPMFKMEYITNSYLNTVAMWCESFFEEYEKAPFLHIKDIFDAESHHLPETDSELIATLLGGLDSQYDEGAINLKYWVEMAGEYFRSRELEITINNISVLREKGNLEAAEQEIENFQKVTMDLDSHCIVNIGDLKEQEEIYRKRDEDEANFFQLPGDLGKYLGNQKRGDVVGYYGPAKRGKCLSGDNLIYLSDGTIKPLKDVVDQKIEGVLSKDENDLIVKDTVTNWIDCGLKQEITVITKSKRKVKTAKDHHYYTPEGWKQLHELKIGDVIALSKKITPALNNDLIWDRIKSIKKGKLVPMYDLTVKNNHNFIANSFIVHNSFTLINQFKYGVLSKKKTLFWSIEMTKTEVIPRINKTFFPMIDGAEGMYSFPVFDCIHNQNGECSDRNSPTVVLENDIAINDPAHIVCTKCMKHPDPMESKRFKLCVYQDVIFREQDDIFTVRKKHKMFKKMWQKYGRVSCHPKYSLSYDKMMRDLDILWKKFQWFPDIILLDYIDILDINSNFDDYRLEDERWKLLAKIAGQTNTLIITATQANKLGHTTEILDASHQGGFYGKNRHINLMVGLNQTPGNKEDGIMKFGITEARSMEYIPGKTCTVLQDFKTGQAYLDSFYPGLRRTT